MKIIIEQNDNCEETEVRILCPGQKDEMTEELIQHIQNFAFGLKAWKDGNIYKLRQDEIFYIECIEDKTFLYTDKDTYESPLKLYRIEEQLRNTAFVRISKSVLLNCDWLDHVRPLLNAKIEACLVNGEKLLINRHYTTAFRSKFGL